MQRKNKKEIYSIRKFKVGVGSALIGLSFLGATGMLDHVPVVKDVIGVQSVYATEATPQPEGNVIARGEDGVPWELYENGYLLFNPETGKDTLTNNWGKPSWKRDHGAKIKHVGFSGSVYAPKDSSWLFSKYGAAGDSENMNFRPLSIDASKINTSKVVNMGQMFSSSDQLTTLAVDSWDTSHVTSMVSMFDKASNLSSLDVAKWNTSNVLYMSSMFAHLNKITELHLSKWDTSKVFSMGSMFQDMHQLLILDVSGWNTSQATGMSTMFLNDNNLTHLDLSSWDMSNVRNLYFMFSKTLRLKEVKIGNHFKPEALDTIETWHLYGNQYTDKWHKVNEPNNAKTVSEWAAAYASNPSANAGTWVREVAVQDATLEFEPGNGERIQPLTFRASSTPTLPTPTVDKAGYKFKGWTLQDGSEVNLSSLPAGSRTTLVGKWEKVNNATTRTVKIPVTTVYEGDSNLDKGKQTEVPGQEGEKRITTTSTVTPITGELTNPVEKEEITQAMRPKVIKVGTKPTKVVETIPSPKQYVKDPEREKGQKDIVTEGTPGTKTTTTTYTANPNNGEVTPHVGEPVTVNPTPTIIKVAAKDKVVVKELPSPVRYEADKGREKGTPDERVEGKPGKEITTTSYEVNPNTGVITETTKVVKESDPTETVIKVGAKTKVEQIQNGTQKIERTTEYTVNPKTGDITEIVTDHVVSDRGLEPPVVENNDFNGGVNGDLDGNPLINEKPAFDESKIKITTEEIPPTVRYEKDETRDRGQENIVIPGEAGQKKVTKVPVLDETGKEIEVTTEEVIKPAGETVIKVAARTKVERIKEGTRTIERITKYDVDSKTGKVTETVTDKLISDTGAEPPVVENNDFNGGVNGDLDGNPLINEKPAFDESKIKITTEEIPPTVRYEKDETRDRGQENIVIPGEAGQKKVTKVPVQDETGKEIEVTTEEVVKPAGETVIKVPAKTKVERIKEGTRTIERTTRYEVDPKTGKITETVTDNLISDTSAEPPVVDVPEFDLSKLPKEPTDFNLGTGKNDFGPKKENPKVEVVPANITTPRTEEVPSEKKADAPKVEAVSQTGSKVASKGELPNTGTADNTALTLAGISLALVGVGLVGKRKFN